MEKITRREFAVRLLLTTGAVPPLISPAFGDGYMNESVENDAYPSYRRLYHEGVLTRRGQELQTIYENCTLCPRDCRVNRMKGETGTCRAPAALKISSAFPHFGEERPLVGKKGSGTIFFSHCGLRCIYCQNHPISLAGEGIAVTEKRLAEAMIKLQRLGCHNINLVTPTHYVPGIVRALELAVPMGLMIPLVYNTGGYEKPETLRLLDGILDVYLPDFKYMNPAHSSAYSSEAYNYPHYARMAFKEMYRQVGGLKLGQSGIARRGLMIRHLVLPNRLADTRQVLEFVAHELSPDCYVNIMRQYRPEHKAGDFPELARRINNQEYREALEWAGELGMKIPLR